MEAGQYAQAVPSFLSAQPRGTESKYCIPFINVKMVAYLSVVAKWVIGASTGQALKCKIILKGK